MVNLLHATLVMCTLATAKAAETMPIAQLKAEYTRHSSSPSDIAGNKSTEVFVFLQKFPLQGRFIGLKVYHTEVLVCPRSGFSEADQATLDSKIAGMENFAEIEKSWWSTKTANCVELGYGGDSCSEECCTVPHDHSTTNYALHESRSVIFNADTTQRSLYVYGTGDFDGNVAYHYTCDHKCWSTWKGTDYNILTNNCNTFTSTVLHNVYGLSQKKPGLGVSDLVTVSGHCPANNIETQLPATRMKCPGSRAALFHAKTQVTAWAKATCDDVKAEMLARVGGQKGWVDPHNGGIYSLISSSGPGDYHEIETKRTTNPKKSFGHQVYTDKQTFTLSATGGGSMCVIDACSESQGTSLKDFSTNYCDIRNLYCGSADGCKPVLHDFTSEEKAVDTSSGQHDWSQCIVEAQSQVDEISV